MDNITRILDFRNLKENWNGYDAKNFDDKTIIKAIDISRKFINCQLPEIFPTARGTVQFEWKKKNTGYLEFEVGSEYVAMLEMDGEDNVIVDGYLFQGEIESINYIVKCVLNKWDKSENRRG